MSEIALYVSSDGRVKLDVRAGDGTFWLTQQQFAALFGRDVTVIRRHLANARREELEGMAASAKFALVQSESCRTFRTMSCLGRSPAALFVARLART